MQHGLGISENDKRGSSQFVGDKKPAKDSILLEFSNFS